MKPETQKSRLFPSARPSGSAECENIFLDKDEGSPVTCGNMIAAQREVLRQDARRRLGDLITADFDSADAFALRLVISQRAALADKNIDSARDEQSDLRLVDDDQDKQCDVLNIALPVQISSPGAAMRQTPRRPGAPSAPVA